MNDGLDFERYLKNGLAQFGLEAYGSRLLEYVLLLHKWNATYNLTAVRDVASMINKHLLDSLAIRPWLKGSRILDVGTGPGLPGVPLAITNPNSQITLLDSNSKKTRFLKEVKYQLDLQNIEIVPFRVENYHPAQGFDTVTSRAFSSIGQMIHWTKHLIAPDGIWLAMKGRYPHEELKLIDKPYHVEPYSVKGIEGERCCVLIKNINKES